MWDPSAVSTPRKALVALVAAPLALILVLVSAYAVDAAVLTSDSVARNVEVSGPHPKQPAITAPGGASVSGSPS